MLNNLGTYAGRATESRVRRRLRPMRARQSPRRRAGATADDLRNLDIFATA